MNFLIRLIEFKKYFLKKENIFFFIFVITIFFLDRLSKLQIINNLNESPYYVNDYINFDLIWNIGIGFGLLSTNSSLLYNFVTILIGIVIILLLYIFAFSNKIDKFIYSIIIGGALGNFYDRITYKAVPDFVDLHYENFHWFTFNVADIFITIGILIYIIRSFFVKD
jgi:signal peptidase II